MEGFRRLGPSLAGHRSYRRSFSSRLSHAAGGVHTRRTAAAVGTVGDRSGLVPSTPCAPEGFRGWEPGGSRALVLAVPHPLPDALLQFAEGAGGPEHQALLTGG